MMTSYLLDTNACIAIRDLLKGKQPHDPERRQRLERLKARWSQIPKERLAMSILTLGELCFGVAKSSNPAGAQAYLDRLRQTITVLGFDELSVESVTQHYGDIRAVLETAGCKIGHNDTWIAAHGRATGRTVVTNNLREFARVPGLDHEDWTA